MVSSQISFSLPHITTQYWNIHELCRTGNGNFLWHTQNIFNQPVLKKTSLKKIIVSQSHEFFLLEKHLQNWYDGRPCFICGSKIRAILLVLSSGSSQCVGLQVRCCSLIVEALEVAEHDTEVCPLNGSSGHQHDPLRPLDLKLPRRPWHTSTWVTGGITHMVDSTVIGQWHFGGAGRFFIQSMNSRYIIMGQGHVTCWIFFFTSGDLTAFWRKRWCMLKDNPEVHSNM